MQLANAFVFTHCCRMCGVWVLGLTETPTTATLMIIQMVIIYILWKCFCVFKNSIKEVQVQNLCVHFSNTCTPFYVLLLLWLLLSCSLFMHVECITNGPRGRCKNALRFKLWLLAYSCLLLSRSHSLCLWHVVASLVVIIIIICIIFIIIIVIAIVVVVVV